MIFSRERCDDMKTVKKPFVRHKIKAKRGAEFIALAFSFVRKHDGTAIAKDVAQIAIAQHPPDPLSSTFPPTSGAQGPALGEAMLRESIYQEAATCNCRVHSLSFRRRHFT